MGTEPYKAILDQVSSLTEVQRFNLAKEICQEFSYSYGHDDLCRGFDLIAQDMAENDAAYARAFRSCGEVNALAGQLSRVAAAGRVS